MNNKLILFTAEFPFGTGETFLETEILYLSEKFDEIVIVSQSQNKSDKRSVPINVRVEGIDLTLSFMDKINALKEIFNPLFKEELRIVKQVYKKKLTKGILSTMLISLYRAKQVKEFALKSFIKDSKIERLFFYSYWCDDVALGLAMVQQDEKDVICVSRIHGWDVYFEASGLNYLPYRHTIVSGLKRVFAISQKGAEYTRTTWKIDSPDKVVVSRIGVPEQTMVKPGVTPFILVSCSNVIPLKRVDLITKALQTLRDYPIYWVHFGDGPQLEKVKQLAKELPSNIHTEFKGRVSNSEVLNWYRENRPHLFINVSTTEGIPVSIMEAMSFGIPVIATNVGGTSEIVNEENGVLLKSDPSTLKIASSIKKMVEHREVLDQKKQVAINTWEQNFNAERNYNSFVQNILNL